MPLRPVISDDYTAPLGLDRAVPPKRWMRLWPLALILAAALIIGVGGWTLFVHDPDGGQPTASVDLPALPARQVPPPAAPAANPAPPALPDDPSGQIIIRDP